MHAPWELWPLRDRNRHATSFLITGLSAQFVRSFFYMFRTYTWRAGNSGDAINISLSNEPLEGEIARESTLRALSRSATILPLEASTFVQTHGTAPPLALEG